MPVPVVGEIDLAWDFEALRLVGQTSGFNGDAEIGLLRSCQHDFSTAPSFFGVGAVCSSAIVGASHAPTCNGQCGCGEHENPLKGLHWISFPSASSRSMRLAW